MSPSLPFFLLAGGGIMASMVAVYLPETTDERLPDTVEEAEEFGRGQKFFEAPFVKKRREVKARGAAAI